MTAEPHASAPGRRAGSARAHWRGELPLAASVWLCFALPLTFLDLAAGALTTWIHLGGSHLQAASLTLLLVWPLLIVGVAWGGVGVWRAAGAYARGRGALLWVGAARVAVVLAMLCVLTAVASSLVPQVGGWLVLARGADPLGTLQAQLTPDGRRLQLSQAMRRRAARCPIPGRKGRPPGCSRPQRSRRRRRLAR